MQKPFLQTIVHIVLGLLLIVCALLIPNYTVNQTLSCLLLLTVIVLLYCPHDGNYRCLFLLITLFLIMRYFFWRSFVSMSLDGSIWDNLSSVLLYSAEIYTLTLLLLGIFTSFYAPKQRIVPPLPEHHDQLPSVDVLIPSYDEPIALLEATLTAATCLDYPAEKLHVYWLDDGSSDAKRTQPDPSLREMAEIRYRETAQLCQRLGITLLTRKDNHAAKAGNLNAALANTDGDLIVVLDADHVVCRDFLQKTVGFFLAEDNVAIVQTPHFFISPNPVEKNLQIFEQSPSENDVFYFVSQPGLDDLNATFFCGSAGLISRNALQEVGGFSEYSVTEDCATSLQIHAKGYDSVYVDQPLIAALQPETIDSYIRQRNRWTQGMIQIFLLDNPLFKKGLTPKQRLGYLSTTLFWFFPYSRLVFFIAPLLYLLFGIHIYHANAEELLSFVIPHLMVIFLATYYLYGGVRRVFMSNTYELFQSCAAFIALIKTLISPGSPRFRSTPKQEIYAKDQVNFTCLPFYILYVLSLAALGLGIWRYTVYDGATPMLFIALFWVVFNVFFLHGVIGAFFERRQRRLFTRHSAHKNIIIKIRHEEISGEIVELSTRGAKIRLENLPAVISSLSLPAKIDLAIDNQTTRPPMILTARIHEVISKAEHPLLRVEFLHDTLSQKRQAICLNYEDSTRWAHIIQKKHQQPALLSSAAYLMTHFFIAFKDHGLFLIRRLLNKKPQDN